MTSLTFSRRKMIALGGASALATLPLPSFALSGGQAEGLVTSAVADINGVIQSGASVSSMVRSFKGIFDRYSDTSYVAAYALGNDGRSASNAQKSAFADAFGNVPVATGAGVVNADEHSPDCQLKRGAGRGQCYREFSPGTGKILIQLLAHFVERCAVVLPVIRNIRGSATVWKNDMT